MVKTMSLKEKLQELTHYAIQRQNTLKNEYFTRACEKAAKEGKNYVRFYYSSFSPKESRKLMVEFASKHYLTIVFFPDFAKVSW